MLQYVEAALLEHEKASFAQSVVSEKSMVLHNPSAALSPYEVQLRQLIAHILVTIFPRMYIFGAEQAEQQLTEDAQQKAGQQAQPQGQQQGGKKKKQPDSSEPKLPPIEEIQLTDAIARYIKARAGYACIYEGDYYDCGDKLEFIKAIINFGLKRKEFKGQLKKYLKNF